MLALLPVVRAIAVVMLLVKDMIAFKLSLLSVLLLLLLVLLLQLPIIYYYYLYTSLSLRKIKQYQNRKCPFRLLSALSGCEDVDALTGIKVF